MIGSMNDEILQMTELAADLIAYLLIHYKDALYERYQIEPGQDGMEAEDTPLSVLKHVCEVRKCYRKGQEIDYEKASAVVVDDFRSGRIARITLEMPEPHEVQASEYNVQE